MVIHESVSSAYSNNNINQTSFSSNNIQPYQYQTINFIQPKYHQHYKIFSTKNVLDAPVFSVTQRKNLTSKDLEVAKKTTEFTNNTDFTLNNNSTSSKRPVHNSTATMSRHHHKMFESIAKNCIVSRSCIDSKNHLVSTNRPDSKNQRHISNNCLSTPTKNYIESKSKSLTVCANADNDPLSKNLAVHVSKSAKNEFSVITTRRFKKDEFILRHVGDKPSTVNFLKHEYSDLDIYFNRFVEPNHSGTMDGNMYAPFIHRSGTPNCYIQITKEGNSQGDSGNNRDSEHVIYKVGIFALSDIKPGVELTLGLNLVENSLIPITQQDRSHPTANSTSFQSRHLPQPSRPLLLSNHPSPSSCLSPSPSQSPSQLDQFKDSFPMSIQITSEERHHHNKFQNLITAIQLLETSIVNYCIEHATDPITSPVEKLTETAIMLFGLPQSTFSRIHAIISICLRENIGIDQCQSCLLNAFRLFLEWNTTNNNSSEASTLIHGSTSSRYRRYHNSRSSNAKISIFEKFVTCFLLSLKGTFDVIPIPTFMWSERLSISKYRLVRWELECLKAIRFEVMITSALYFCWLGKLCDELEV